MIHLIIPDTANMQDLYTEQQYLAELSRFEAKERMRFTLFLSILVHLFLILGIGISYVVTHQDKAIEVTLMRDDNEQKKQLADFIAQSNQQGDGTLKDAKLQFTTTNVPIKGNNIEEVLKKLNRQTHTNKALKSPTDEVSLNRIAQKVIVTTGLSQQTITLIKRNQSVPFAVLNPFANSTAENEALVEAVEARLAKEAQQLTKKKRVVTISAVATQANVNAEYIYNWIKRVERVGNAYYPQIAQQFGLQGVLQMLVALKQDGTIDYVRVVRSSGFPRLDDAAVRIVRIAAPFESMPPKMQQNIDRLQIVRTWLFEKDDLRTETATSINATLN